MTQNPNLFTVSQFVERNPAFTNGGLRWHLFNSDKNGLKESGAIIRLGRRVLIDADKFFVWVYSQGDA